MNIHPCPSQNCFSSSVCTPCVFWFWRWAREFAGRTASQNRAFCGILAKSGAFGFAAKLTAPRDLLHEPPGLGAPYGTRLHPANPHGGSWPSGCWSRTGAEGSCGCLPPLGGSPSLFHKYKNGAYKQRRQRCACSSG